MAWLNFEITVAAYAAVVATGALFLEVRRWFESGARLSLSLMPDAVLVGATGIEEKGLLVATVVNRGNTPCTITHFGILRFKSPLHRWLNRSSESYFIPHPQLVGHPPAIPKEVGPGQKWTGIGHSRTDIIPELRNGRYYVAIYATHADKPTIKRIPEKKDVLPDDSVEL